MTIDPAYRFNLRPARVKVTMGWRDKDGPSFQLHSTSLYDFMKMEAALILSGPTKIKTCAHKPCSMPFIVAAPGGKRGDALYCSGNCRKGASRLRRVAKSKSETAAH